MLLRRREDWDDEEAWEESRGDGERDARRRACGAQHELHPCPPMRPLPEQTPPEVDPESVDDWLSSAREQLPGWPDDTLLGYRENGWSIEQLVAYRDENP